MKRFTVIVAMLALMLASVATANAGIFTNPETGADVLTGYSFKGISVVGNNTIGYGDYANHSAFTGTVSFTEKKTGNFNMTGTGKSYNGSNLYSIGSTSEFNAQFNTTATKNNTFTATGNGISTMVDALTGNFRGYKMASTADKNLFFLAGDYMLGNESTSAMRGPSAGLSAIAQTKNASVNRLVGTWKIFGMILGHNSTQSNKTRPQYVMGEMIVNSTASQFGNATFYYKRNVDGGGWTKATDKATLSYTSGLVSSASGDFNWFTNGVLDKTGNTIISTGNTTTQFGVGEGKSSNGTAMFIAIRAASDGSSGITSLKVKKYTLLGIGTNAWRNSSNTGSNGGKPCMMNVGSYGTLSVSSAYKFAAAYSNVTAWTGNNTNIGGYTGNGSISYGTFGLQANPLQAIRFQTQAVHSFLDGANFTGAMRVDGNMYAGLIINGKIQQLAVLIPETSDAVEDLSSLSTDFVTDKQFLAATGLNQCPRANASQGGACFELSHVNYPTTGLNARQANAITVSTYVASVIGAADNASVMSSALFNTTARADSADHAGNFTSEDYAGAPDELKSMYAFNGTSFLLSNASKNVQLLAKWVFVANGSGAIGNVAGLTAKDADPWKYMKKYTNAKNATAYTKVYGNGTLQNWSSFWDADGNVVALSDGVVFYTQYGTNKSLLAPMQTSDTFAAGSKYVLWAVLANNGLFDLDNATDFVFDPPRIITDEDIIYSSSSSSGCVFNPVAGFGLEWLLLLLAPAIGIIRNRFRK